MPAATKIPDHFKDKKFRFTFDDDEVVMVEDHYADNGRLCIRFFATGEFPELFATLTMNLDDDPGTDAFFVKTYSENARMIPELLASGVFIDMKHPRDTAWKFSKGRLVNFEHGRALEDEIVYTQDGRHVPAKNVQLGEIAWRPDPRGGGLYLGERQQQAPTCPYCQAASECVDGTVIYPHRPDLAEKKFWRCAPCDAYVGCHDGTPEPFGRLANAELRQAKTKAHIAFDPIWRTGRMTRSDAYRWLAEKLGISIDECHIGMFDVEQCEKVVHLAAAEMGRT